MHALMLWCSVYTWDLYKTHERCVYLHVLMLWCAVVQVAVGPRGHIYVTEFGNDRVTVLVARRKFETEQLPRGRKSSPG